VTVVQDNSGWIALLSGSDRAQLYQPALRAERLIVPAVVRYEIGRYTLTHAGQRGHELALRSLSKFQQMPLNEEIADAAALIAHRHSLDMADSMVYASTLSAGAELWTQDRHFEKLDAVRYFPKSQDL
jgi:predicted nucleic acid-binding protein